MSIISMADAVLSWLAGTHEEKTWYLCSDCNGSGYVIEATHIEEGYVEFTGDQWDAVLDDDFLVTKSRHRCTTCHGSGSYYYDNHRLIPGKGDEFNKPQKSVTYRDYIRSEEWKGKAIVAKTKAGWRCQVCNRPSSEVQLDAHHRTYERLGHERPEDITVLCRDCHELYETNKRLKPQKEE